MNNTYTIRQQLEEASAVLKRFLEQESNLSDIAEAGNLFVKSLKNGGKLISCGNGGSMCDAMHFAEELTGRFRADRPPIAALSISDPSHLSCVSNDYGYENVFSRYVDALGNAGDVLLAISTSGNSANVIRAAEAAKNKGMSVVALTGKDGGKLSQISDVEIRDTHSEFADRAQEIHIKVIHCLIHFIEENY